MAKKGATASSASDAPPGALLDVGAPSEAATARPYTVLARRYRSRDFDEVVGQEPIARTLKNAISAGRTAHAYLFCGTRGVGKTSMARIFARALNRDPALRESDAIGDAILRGEDLDVIEIDGASNRGIDDARDLIAGAGLAPTRGKYRIYIIDEVHMLTTPAFNALLKTMEEPPAHVKFILCTTEPHKVPQTIQSRCQRFDFRNIPTKEIARHLGEVSRAEKIEVTEEVLLAVARLANGSMRDGLSLLDRLLAAADGRVDAKVLEDVFGLPDDEILLAIIEACVADNPGDALRHGARLLERGSGVEQALELLAERFRWVLVASAAGGESDLLEVAQSMRDRVLAVASSVDTAFAAHAIALCDATSRNARGSSAPRALYDACLARLALSRRFSGGAALLAGGGADPKKAGNPAAPRATGPATIAAATPAARPAAAAPARAGVVEPRMPAPASTPAPAPAASPEPARTPAELRERLAALAARSPKDEAMLGQFEVVAFDGESARIILRADDASGRFLASNPEPLRALVAKAAGRFVRVAVEVDVEAAESAEPEAPRISVGDPSVRNDPLVRKATELFDASVVAVSPRMSADADAPAEGEPAGEAADRAEPVRDEPLGAGEPFDPMDPLA